MKLTIQSLNDSKEKMNAEKLPKSDFKKLIESSNKKTQKIKRDILKAFREVQKIQKGDLKARKLSDFLKEL